MGQPMDDRLTRALKLVAVAMAVAFVGWAVYEKFVVDVAPGDMAYHSANRLFEDGHYERAAKAYREALEEAPDHLDALRGLARSLHMAGAHEEALALYDEAIAHAPEFGATLPIAASCSTPWGATRRRWPTTCTRSSSIPSSPRAQAG